MTRYRYVNNTVNSITTDGSGHAVQPFSDLVLDTRDKLLDQYIGPDFKLYIDGVEDTHYVRRSPEATTLLFFGNALLLTQDSDYQLQKVFQGTSYVPTMVILKSVFGNTTGTVTGGIYDEPNKAGTQILPANTSFTGLSTTIPIVLDSVSVNKVLPISGACYFSLNTGFTSSTDCHADVFVFGAILDRPVPFEPPQ